MPESDSELLRAVRTLTVPAADTEYDRETRAAALEAANRIMHGAGTENDYQLVAGVLFELLSSRR